MKKRIIIGIFLFLGELVCVATQGGDDAANALAVIRASNAYHQLKVIASKHAPLIIAATDDIFTARRYIRIFSQKPLKATKNIIQHAGYLFRKKKDLNRLITLITVTTNQLMHEVALDRMPIHQSLVRLTAHLVHISNLFKELGRLRKVHRLRRNMNRIMMHLQRCKVIVQGDPVLFEMLDTFLDEKEIVQLTKTLKQIRRRNMKKIRG